MSSLLPNLHSWTPCWVDDVEHEEHDELELDDEVTFGPPPDFWTPGKYPLNRIVKGVLECDLHLETLFSPLLTFFSNSSFDGLITILPYTPLIQPSSMSAPRHEEACSM